MAITKQQKAYIEEINRILPKIDKYTTEIAGHNNIINKESATLSPMEEEINRLKTLLDIARNKQEVYDKLQLEVDKKTSELAACESISVQIQENINGSIGQIRDLEKSFTSLKPKYDALFLKKGQDAASLILVNSQISDISGKISNLNKIFNESKKLNEKNIKIIGESNTRINELKKRIKLLKQKNYSNTVYNNQNLLNLSKNIDSSLNNLFTYLKKQNISPNVIYEKIEYRDIEHEKLYNTNKIIDVLFYCFYFAFVLIMICIGNTKREYFLIYLFIGLIPFIYPFIFKLLLYIIKYLSTNIHGPKNAFVDINNTLYA
jgi:chromosome segregation ATPase